MRDIIGTDNLASGPGRPPETAATVSVPNYPPPPILPPLVSLGPPPVPAAPQVTLTPPALTAAPPLSVPPEKVTGGPSPQYGAAPQPSPLYSPSTVPNPTGDVDSRVDVTEEVENIFRSGLAPARFMPKATDPPKSSAAAAQSGSEDAQTTPVLPQPVPSAPIDRRLIDKAIKELGVQSPSSGASPRQRIKIGLITMQSPSTQSANPTPPAESSNLQSVDMDIVEESSSSTTLSTSEPKICIVDMKLNKSGNNRIAEIGAKSSGEVVVSVWKDQPFGHFLEYLERQSSSSGAAPIVISNSSLLLTSVLVECLADLPGGTRARLEGTVAGLMDTTDLLEMSKNAEVLDQSSFPVVPDLIASWSMYHNKRKPLSELTDDSTRANIALIQSILDKVDTREVARRARNIDLSSPSQTEILVQKDLSIRQGRSAPVLIPWPFGEGEDPKQHMFLSDPSEDFMVHSVSFVPPTPENLSLSVSNSKGSKLRLKKFLRLGWMVRRGSPVDMALLSEAFLVDHVGMCKGSDHLARLCNISDRKEATPTADSTASTSEKPSTASPQEVRSHSSPGPTALPTENSRDTSERLSCKSPEHPSREVPSAPSEEWERFDRRNSNPSPPPGTPPRTSELDRKLEHQLQVWKTHSIDPLRSPKSSFVPKASKKNQKEPSRALPQKPPSPKKRAVKQPAPPPPLSSLYSSSASESSSLRRSVDSPKSDSSVKELDAFLRRPSAADTAASASGSESAASNTTAKNTRSSREKQRNDVASAPKSKPSKEEVVRGQIEKVQVEVDKLAKRVAVFEGDEEDREYLKEKLRQHLISLDGFEINGNDTLQKLRRKSILSINKFYVKLDSKASQKSPALPVEVLEVSSSSDEYEDIEVEEVEEIEVEEQVMIEREIETEEEVEVENTVEEFVTDDFVPDMEVMEDKFLALSAYEDFRPFVITFLKMSAKNSDFDAEAEHANEIIMALVCAEVPNFADLEPMVKRAVTSKKVSLSALKEALKSELPIAYGSMEDNRFNLFVAIVKEHYFGGKPKPRKVKKVVKKMEKRMVRKKITVPEMRKVKKQQVKKVKKRVKKKKQPAKSTIQAAPDRRDSGASEPRVNPRDPRLRRDSGAAEPRAGNPRDPRLQRMNSNKPAASQVVELAQPQGWGRDGGAKQQPASTDERIADPIIEELFMSSPPREPTPPPPPPTSVPATRPKSPVPLTQGVQLNMAGEGKTREAYPSELFYEFKIDVLVTTMMKRFESAYLLCYAPLRPEMVADCNSIDIVVDPWVVGTTGFLHFKFHYLACNLIIVRAFNKLEPELKLGQKLTLARGFYPNLGKNQAPGKKEVDPSFQIQRQCRIIFSHPAKVYLIGADRRGKTFFMAPRGTGTDMGSDILVKAVALPEEIKTMLQRYNNNCFVPDNLGLITKEHFNEMQALLNLMVTVKVARDLGLPEDEQKDLDKVRAIIKNLVKEEFDLPEVISEPTPAQSYSVPEPGPSKKPPTAAQVFNIKRERNPSDGYKSNCSTEKVAALTIENLSLLNEENPTHSPPAQQLQQQKQVESASPVPAEEEDYVACGELTREEEARLGVTAAKEKSPSPGPSSRDTRGKRKRSSASAYSSPSPIRPESKQGSLQRKRQREITEEDNQDEELSWRREMMRNPDRGGGDVNGELDLGIDRLLSDQRGGMPRSPNASRDRVSRSQSGSRDRDSRERHLSSVRNAGNISDGFEIPGLGRVCNAHNVKMEPCTKYHTKANCPKSKSCQNQHGFPSWMDNTFCKENLSELPCDDRNCRLRHGSLIDFIRDYQAQLKHAVGQCNQCQELRGRVPSTRRMSPGGERGRDRPEGMDDYVNGWSEIYQGRQISDNEKRREKENLDGWAAHVSRQVSKNERSIPKGLRSEDSRERSSRSRSPRSRSRDRRNSRDSRDLSQDRRDDRTYQIYVGLGNLSDASITNNEIRDYFQSHGNVLGLDRPVLGQFRKKAAYCFVTFDARRPAEKLLQSGSVKMFGQRVQIKPTRNEPKDRRSVSRGSPVPGGSERDERRRTRSSSRERSRERNMRREKGKRRHHSRDDSSDRSRGRRRRRRSGRSRTRSRSRGRSAESGEILELSSDPDVAAGGSSVKRRLGPKQRMRSRSSSSNGSKEWSEVQESRSGNRNRHLSLSSSKSSVSKRLGPRIHTSSDEKEEEEEEEGRVSVKDRLGVKARKPANAPYCRFYNSWDGCRDGYACPNAHVYNKCRNYFGPRGECKYGKSCQFNHRTEYEMKKLLRKQRKREQLIDSSEDDDGGDDGGVTLSSDDANAGGGNSDAVRLKVKLLTEHVSGDDRETDVVAEIVSENSYEDWQVDVETRLTCLPGGFIKTDKFENLQVEAGNKVRLKISSRGLALKAGDVIGEASNPRPSRKGRFAPEPQRVR